MVLSGEHPLCFKKAGQPLDQALADHDLIDDLSCVVDQVALIDGLDTRFGRPVQETDFHEMAMEFLLGELLCCGASRSTSIELINVCVECAAECLRASEMTSSTPAYRPVLIASRTSACKVFREANGHHGVCPLTGCYRIFPKSRQSEVELESHREERN